MINRRNTVFIPVRCPDGKRHEWSYFQMLANIADHNWIKLPQDLWSDKAIPRAKWAGGGGPTTISDRICLRVECGY